jgi:NAD(P)-dependent dehydrogenase (short-subunit alcohol dehydrogenase family)
MDLRDGLRLTLGPQHFQEIRMRTWFITGASRGFGALIAARALAAGDAVIATARDPQTIPADIRSHGNALAQSLDVGSDTQAREAVRAGVERFGRVDVLLNNAGYGLIGAIEESSGEEVERIFRTNVFGLLNVTRAVLPQMRAQRAGRVLNISSIGGYASAMGFGIYCATKFAVEAISESMHAELAPLGIHTTVIEPGYFRTGFLSDKSVVSTASQLDDYAQTVGNVRRFAQGADGQQPGDPRKLAEAVMQLVEAPQPPLRLPLGADTVARIEQKHREVEAELARCRALSLSTGFL